MESVDLLDLTDRLRKLERESRIWRTGSVIALCAVICGASQDAGELRVRDLRIVDSKGKTRIRMRADEDPAPKNGYLTTGATGFVLFDQNEQARVVLVARDDQASIHLYHGHSLHQEADINLVSATERGQFIDIRNNDRKVELRVNGQNGSVLIKDQRSPAESGITLDATKTPRTVKSSK